MNQDQNYSNYSYGYSTQPVAESQGFDQNQMYGGWNSQPAYAGASYSQPAGYASTTKTKPAGLYKTQLCRHFEQKGFCNLGEKCNFAHGKEELREAPPGTEPTPVASSYNYGGGFQQKTYQQQPSFTQVDHSSSKYYKTVLCRNFQQTGQCSFGPNCKFAHGDDELRAHPMGSMQPGSGYAGYSAPAMQYSGYSNQPTALPGYYPGYEMGGGYSAEGQMSAFPPSNQAVAGTDAHDSSQNYSYNYTPEGGMYPGYDGGYDGSQAYTAPTGANDNSNQYYAQNLSGSGFHGQEGFQQ
jgi:hypothetical protein